MTSKLILENTPESKKLTGLDLYSRFAFAGAVSCAVTHGAITPVDVVKTRIQLDPQLYKGGMVSVFKQVIRNEGAGALLTGLGPTISGYFIQGALKFGGYEFWKSTFIDMVGIDAAMQNRSIIYLGSSALAEIVADVALCPLEATRIRLVSNPTFATGLISGFSRILKEEGVLRGFYSGFIPILFKQVPYTMAKFFIYEHAAEAIYNAVPTPKHDLSPTSHTAINLGAGLTSGVVAAIISQPADTLLSKINKQKNSDGPIISRLASLAKELGPRGLFLGMGARVVMVGALTAGQFGINGDIKRALGITSGIELSKPSKL